MEEGGGEMTWSALIDNTEIGRQSACGSQSKDERLEERGFGLVGEGGGDIGELIQLIKPPKSVREDPS